ncbi:sodium channel protein Nach [Diachasma alloeum]|uniref:sodium channel protein Nach n=1 Tax=Diachasma alloeum TaxID=454923 RepID=UPI0007384876|nr:sodium channel protein Nach [Diachasma alloeum]
MIGKSNDKKIPLENSPRLRSSQLARTLKKQAIEFCTETGLHGYKYMVEEKRSKTERIIWGIIVFSALSCAAVLMHTAWVYNSSRATLTVIESTHRGIWNYPFPAITICNLNRMSFNKTRKFVKGLKLPKALSQEYVINEMRLLLELLDPGVFGGNLKSNFTTLQDIFDDNNYSIADVVRAVSQNCSEFILHCKWKGIPTACEKLFRETLSRDGVCCSFNYISTRAEKKKTFPKRITACGYQTGLTLLLNPEPTDYFATILGAYGSKIQMHYSYDYPDWNAESKIIASGYQVFLSISPEETHTTHDVRKLALRTRKCMFSDEGDAKYNTIEGPSNLTYATYSYTNCIAECRATIMKALCNCVPYYYPQNATRVCDLRDVRCLNYNKGRFETSFPGTQLSSSIITTSPYLSDSSRPCGCQPDCLLYRYPVEESSGALDRSNSYNQRDIFHDLDIKNQSLVHIFFSDLVSIQYRRNISYDWRNLFASFGGLLGLFAGFSLMSGFEIIYFFIVRLITDTYMRNKQRFSH